MKRIFRFRGRTGRTVLPMAVRGRMTPKPPTTVQQLDHQLAGIFKQGKIPGATFALIENGQVTFTKGYGYADVAKKMSSPPPTRRSAPARSPKSFTSVAIMTLVEQNKLSLDAKLADLAPGGAFRQSVGEDQSGPPREPARTHHRLARYLHPRAVRRRQDVVDAARRAVHDAGIRQPLEARHDDRLANNAGPAVAGVALEKASGKTYDQYMRDAVLRPMGMAAADFDLTPDLAKRIAKSYGTDGSITPYQYIVLKPAGSLNVSARELAQLARLYLGWRQTVGWPSHPVRPRRWSIASSAARSNLVVALEDGFTEAYALGNAIFPMTAVDVPQPQRSASTPFGFCHGNTTRASSTGYD